jgi:hypothetical protein
VGVFYYNNKSAWTTGFIFADMVKKFDSFFRGKKYKQPVCFMDNASTHMMPPGAKAWSWGSLKGFTYGITLFVFLPKNTTAHVQPMDAGYIVTFKAGFRIRQVRWVLAQVEAGETNLKLDLRSAITWCVAALKDMRADTRRLCWAKCKILPLQDTSDLRNSSEYARAVPRNKLGVSETTVNTLADLLKQLSLKPELFGNAEVLSVNESLDIEGESQIEAMLADEDLVEFAKCAAEAAVADQTAETEPADTADANTDSDTEDAPPRRAITTKQAHHYMEELAFYLGENLDQVGDPKKVNSAATFLSDTLSRIMVSSAAVQTELFSYFTTVPLADRRGRGLSDDEDTARRECRGNDWEDNEPMDDEDADMTDDE